MRKPEPPPLTAAPHDRPCRLEAADELLEDREDLAHLAVDIALERLGRARRRR